MKALILLMVCLLMGCATPPEKKYASKSTAELKLRHRQCVEFLNGEKKDWEIKFGNPLFMGDGGRGDRIREKEEIEMELLRRCRGGDSEACR